VLAFAKEDSIYGDIAIFGEDVLQEQSDRIGAVNLYLEQQQQRLVEQIAAIPKFGLDAVALNTAIQSELAGLIDNARWD
jgi:hypothetical protein